MDNSLPSSGYSKKLVIGIQATVLGMVGMDKFRSAFREMNRLQGDAAKSAEAAAVRATRAQEAATRTQQRLIEQQAVLARRLAMEDLKQTQYTEDNKIRAKERTALRIKQLNAQIAVSNERVALSERQIAAAADEARVSQLAARRLATRSVITGGIGRAGTLALGAGAVGLIGGYEVAKYGADWQRYMLQQQAMGNFGNLSPAKVQQFALSYGMSNGADFRQLAMSARFGSDFGFNWRLNKRVVQAATMAALPVGGDITGFTQALGSGLVNYPTYQKDPKAAMNMILMASKLGRANPQDFTNSVSRVLMMTGQLGNPALFGQSLSAVSALTREGLNPDVSSMMTYNALAHLLAPSKGQKQFLDWLKTNKGIDLSGDFGATALRTKGLAGIFSDIHNAHLAPDALKYLLPDLRGYFGVLGLTGVGHGNYTDILGKVNTAPQQDPVGKYYKQYLGLTTTQAARLQNEFKRDAIVLSTALLPATNTLLKDTIPMAHGISEWVKQNKGLIATFVELSPKLLLIGAGLKALLIAGRVATAIKALDIALGMSATLGLRGALVGTEAGTGKVIGTRGAGSAAGTGLLGMLSASLALAAALKYIVIPAVTDVVKAEEKWAHIHLPGGKNVTDFINQYVLNGRNPIMPGMPWPDLGGGNSPTGHGGTAATPHGTIRMSAGYANIVPSGTEFGSNFPTSGTSGNAAKGVGFLGYRAKGVLYLGGPSGVVTDTDFGTGKKSFVVELPGGDNAEYRYLGSLNDDQAGLVQEWVTPSVTLGGKNYLRGHFAVLHLRSSAKLTVGAWYKGGTKVGMSGFPPSSGITNSHLCIQADAPARAYFAWAQRSRGAGGSNAGTSLRLPQGEAAYSGSFVAAGTQSNVDPSVLAGIGKAESGGNVGNNQKVLGGDGNYYGSMGVNVAKYGSNAGGQIGGAGKEMQTWFNWLKKNPKFVAAHKNSAIAVWHRLGVKNPSPDEIILCLALACFNAGAAGKYFDDSSPGDGHGMYYAQTVLASAITANHGTAPAGYYSGQGAGRVSPNPGYQVTASGYNSGHSAHGPKYWASWWSGQGTHAQSVLSTIFLNAPKNADGTVNFNKLPSTLRQASDKVIKQLAYDQYMQQIANIKATISDPKVRATLMAQAKTQYNAEIAHPERWYNSSTRSGAYNGTAGHVSQLHETARRCKAEGEANKIRRGIEGAGKTTRNHTVKHTGQNATMIHLLAVIAKNTGNNGITRAGPAQGTTRISPSPSKG